jgi:hypothetical protein
MERPNNGHEIEIGQEAGYSGQSDPGDDQAIEEHEDTDDNGHEIPIGDEVGRDDGGGEAGGSDQR